MWATQIVDTTPPVVWLTENPLGEGTTAVKARLDGYRGNGVGHLCRVLVRDSPDLLNLPDYSASVGVEAEAWEWVIRTAMMIGIDPSVWRLCPRDIPSEEWVGVEVMSGIDAEGTTWQGVGCKMTGAKRRRARRGRK